jgi:fumarate reductase flavoprotein subunit
MTNTSRRTFFKTAALGAVGAAATVTGAAAAAETKEAAAEYDLIILGAGCAGLTCAVRAKEDGLKPLLLEKMPSPAGNTIYAAGFMLGINTSFKKGLDLPADSKEAFLEDWMKVSQGKAVKETRQDRR